MQIGKMKFDQSAPQYNRQVRSFFIKLALLASAWFICYHLVLKPGRTIDRPLTNFLTASVAKCIDLATSQSYATTWRQSPDKACSYIVQNGKQVLGIWDVCNGIDLMFIYVAIIILLPYPFRRKLLFTSAGIIIIIIANIIRVCALFTIYIHYRSAFDFSHHYLFTLLMYVVIFYGWILYTKKELVNG
jgi:exosortase/archaeosortase family protein